MTATIAAARRCSQASTPRRLRASRGRTIATTGKRRIAEAAFMTGLERNADVVTMASYAPLFAHVDAWQWTPNLIWFDNLRSYGTPNYYVQKMYATNLGTHVVPVDVNGSAKNAQDGLYTSASIDQQNCRGDSESW